MAANKEIEPLDEKQPGTRGTYLKLTEKQKADIAAYAVENEGTSAVRHLKKLGISVNESSVRTWVGKYKDQQKKLLKAGETDLRVKAIPSAKRGSHCFWEMILMHKRKSIYEHYETRVVWSLFL